MNISVSREALSVALAAAARAIPSRPAQPALAGVVLDVVATDDERHVLVVIGGDGENWIRTRIECTSDGPGTVAVSGVALHELVKDLTGDILDIETSPEALSIKLKRGNYALPVFKDAVPFVPALTGPVGSVSGAEFAKAVGQVAVAASKSESTVVLTGVRMELAGSKIVLAATDRYRLSTAEVDVALESDESVLSVIVPVKQLTDAARLFAKEPIVTISVADGTIAFTTPDTSVHARLVSGDYPEWRRLMAVSPTFTVTADAAEFAGALKRNSRINADNVCLEFKDGGITVSGTAADAGSGSEEIPASFDETVEIAVKVLFNPGLLLDGLASFAGATVTIAVADPIKPVLIGDGSAHAYLAMPRRSTWRSTGAPGRFP